MRYYKRVLFLLIVLAIVGLYDVVTTHKDDKKDQEKRTYKEMTVTTKQDEEINQILLYPFAIILGAGSVWCLFALVIGITEKLRKEKRR